MRDENYPAPEEGFVVTHTLIVKDVDRSRDFYVRVFGGEVVREREPAIVKLANSWIIINVGGGPTEDKPDVTLAPPRDLDRVDSFLNLRVADIRGAYDDWRSRGAEFLTPPVDHGHEVRAYVRDPDGYLVEVGETTEPPR